MPETRTQRKKLKERSLVAEIKMLRQSLLSMKSGIHLEAAGRVGANTRIPYPRRDYGKSKPNSGELLLESACELGSQVKASSDWEELDLRSNSPSATSVQECARMGVAVGNEDAAELTRKVQCNRLCCTTCEHNPCFFQKHQDCSLLALQAEHCGLKP